MKQCTVEDCERKLHANGMCAMHNQRVYKAAKRHLQHKFTCKVCGLDGIGGKASQKVHPGTCLARLGATAYSNSMAQKYLEHCRSQSQELVKYVNPTPLPITTVIKGGIVFSKQCEQCGTQFLSRYKYHYCSTKCRSIAIRESKRESRQRRRARTKNAFVSKVYRQRIYLRDNNTCQLCHSPLNMAATVPQHKKQDCCETSCFLAPTIDHIIPLARGGTHEPSNVQAAHFICNARKSDAKQSLF